MIGNTDWLPTTAHNMKLFQSKERGFFPVPYDFDFSGLVNPVYATPKDDLPIRSVTERFFMGNYASMDQLRTTLVDFRQSQEAMLAVIDDFKPLPRAERRRMRDFLISFFDLLEQPEADLQPHFVESHARFPKLALLKLGLGFVDQGIIDNTLYPGTDIHLVQFVIVHTGIGAIAEEDVNNIFHRVGPNGSTSEAEMSKGL